MTQPAHKLACTNCQGTTLLILVCVAWTQQLLNLQAQKATIETPVTPPTTALTAKTAARSMNPPTRAAGTKAGAAKPPTKAAAPSAANEPPIAASQPSTVSVFLAMVFLYSKTDGPARTAEMLLLLA